MENNQNQGIQSQNIIDRPYMESVNIITNQIMEGNADPMKAYIALKKMEKIVETLKENKEIKDVILKHAQAHLNGAKSVKIMDATISVRATRTVYDFSTCGDPEWNSINTVYQQIKALKDQREAILKAAFPDSKVVTFGFKAPTVVVESTYALTEEGSGEVVTLSAPRKLQSEGVVVTLKKD